MPAKAKTDNKESIDELKAQLRDLQERVSSYEEVETSPKYEVKELYSWRSPERVFIPRDKKWFTYIILMVLLITIGLLFLKQFIIIAPVAAVAFVAYVLASVPPENIKHRITNQGINTAGHSYLWDELADFWFTKRGTETIIHIDTYLRYPRRLIMLLGDGEAEKIKSVFVEYIPFREIPKESFMDKAADWLARRFHKLAS